jgi:ADP-ribose pyrophosphatase
MRPDATRKVFEGRLISVSVEQWGPFEREVVQHGPAVAIVAVDEEGRVALVRQRREAVRRELLELPAGGIDEDESPLAAARRELAEETGLHGGEWRELVSFFTTPGFTDERMHLFLAEGVQAGAAAPMDDEEIELVRMSREELGRLLPELEDAKTLVGVLLYLRGLEQGQELSAAGR